MLLNDIDQKKKKEIELQERAEKDGLTGLYNAATVKMKINTFLQSLWAVEGQHIFVLMDLDNFKQINDTFGHQFGDEVLREVAEVLRSKLRHDDIIGRLGGDEFVFMLLKVLNLSSIEHVFAELNQALHKTYRQGDKEVTVSASFGIPGDREDILEVFAYIVKTMFSGNFLKDYIEERVVEIADYIIKNNATVRQAAKQFGISKSTVHIDITKEMFL